MSNTWFFARKNNRNRHKHVLRQKTKNTTKIFVNVLLEYFLFQYFPMIVINYYG